MGKINVQTQYKEQVKRKLNIDHINYINFIKDNALSEEVKYTMFSRWLIFNCCPQARCKQTNKTYWMTKFSASFRRKINIYKN